MNEQVISAIRNASEEYRRLASKLSEIMSGLQGTGADIYDEGGLAGPLEDMESQIRRLDAAADSLQEIADIYLRAAKGSEYAAALPESASPYPEFGVSRFANLAKHEKLLPIHME